MFRVPTYLARSSIHGMGVFTPFPIARGTVLWDYDEGVDWRLAPDELAAFPEPFQERLRHYCYQEKSGIYVLCGDNARYMNHSFEPNCDDRGEHTVALRDIAAFEELTCDYRDFDAESTFEELSELGGDGSRPPRRTPRGLPGGAAGE